MDLCIALMPKSVGEDACKAGYHILRSNSMYYSIYCIMISPKYVFRLPLLQNILHLYRLSGE